jgi:hypothetical protein
MMRSKLGHIVSLGDQLPPLVIDPVTGASRQLEYVLLPIAHITVAADEVRMREFVHSVDLKLARAVVQAKTLANAISVWASENPIGARCELRESRLGCRLVVEDFADPSMVDDWGLLLGECIHNLRSSLDNLAFALARLRCDPPEKPSKIAFPIFETRAEFEKRGRANIDQLPEQAVALIELVQPFQRGNSKEGGRPDLDALVHLQRLNNTDKHRVPPIVLIAPTNVAHSLQVEFNSEEDAAANTPPDTTLWVGPLKPGVVLLDYKTSRPIASVKGRFDGQAVVAIQTPKGFERVDTYVQSITYYTGLVVEQFRPFFP